MKFFLHVFICCFLCSSYPLIHALTPFELKYKNGLQHIARFSMPIDLVSLKNKRMFNISVFKREENTFFSAFYEFPVRFCISDSVFSFENVFFENYFMNINTFIFMVINECKLNIEIERRKFLKKTDVKIKINVDVDESKIYSSTEKDPLNTLMEFPEKYESLELLMRGGIGDIRLWLDELLRTYQVYTFKISDISNGVVTEPFKKKMISMKTRLFGVDFDKFSVKNFKNVVDVLACALKNNLKVYWNKIVLSSAAHMMSLFNLSKKDVENLMIK